MCVLKAIFALHMSRTHVGHFTLITESYSAKQCAAATDAIPVLVYFIPRNADSDPARASVAAPRSKGAATAIGHG